LTCGVLVWILAHSGIPACAQELKLGSKLERRGDEIAVCGEFFHTTAPVVPWLDPRGYDAYRVERRFVPLDQAATPPPEKKGQFRGTRFSLRRRGLTEAELERVRGGGWDLPLLQKTVDQLVIHFDARGTSRRCFEVLHDIRGLSVHFMLDLDGTIYQTLDVKEGAWHATIANGRSIGIEIANIGAYPPEKSGLLEKWYRRGAGGRVEIAVPDPDATSGIRDHGAILKPSRNEPIEGVIQGQMLRQFDLTERQYDSLIRLTATLCTLFPKIRCDYPRDSAGALVRFKLSESEFSGYQGILGHYHVQSNKVDPGPAFRWDKVIDGARRLMAK
jgi:hypothetical protein